MRVFLDTNVFVAAVTSEAEHGPVAVELLDEDHEFVTSLLNLMEMRTVLTKKRRLETERADGIEDEVRSGVEVVVPDASDLRDANALQRETYLYPMGCVILACADGCDATLASFDAELVENGAVTPQSVVED
ncbi:putative nucleic acid-binding protein [Halarchaeum rubridurum]|uniref:Ribonuclease VapC n=1 Tax=Halarchaeum rubridurum TaxID=489911 RepID=A0A830G476_9EURY|nr:PIN domain-containing protein [Halarchaeum rubridurum]MBP1955785.1 putative nucleic acid-binding protein [Halarchaeum rubridurum]GGM74559.1 hypothetical protein GCM10009017_25650 [Halarchaeum rubridurum]